KVIMNENILSNIFLILSILFTFLAYFSARYVYLKLNKIIFLQPMLVATSVLIILIVTLGIPLDNYQYATHGLTWMIAPLSICLMVPLAENIKEIGKILPHILFTLLICGTF